MVIFAYFFIPQIFFYGVSSLAGGILNARGHFAAPMWTPVINNIVVILVLLLFIATGGIGTQADTISAGQVELLGLGHHPGHRRADRGAVPGLRRVGFRWRPRFDFRRAEVTEIRRMAAPAVRLHADHPGVLPRRPERGERRLDAARRDLRLVLHLQLCLAAVPAAVRDHRDLGDHRAAPPDERSRRRTPLPAGPGRLLHRGPAVLGHRGAGRAAAHRARAPRWPSSCSASGTAAPRWPRPATSARCSASSRSAWCRT